MCLGVLIGAVFSDENESGFIGATFASVLGEVGEGGADDFLIACAGVVDDGDGGVWVESVGKKFGGDGFHGFDGHVVEGWKGGFVGGVAGGDFSGCGTGGECDESA